MSEDVNNLSAPVDAQPVMASAEKTPTQLSDREQRRWGSEARGGRTRREEIRHDSGANVSQNDTHIVNGKTHTFTVTTSDGFYQ